MICDDLKCHVTIWLCLLPLSGCGFIQSKDHSTQGNKDILHLRQTHGIFLPMMMRERDLYLHVSSDRLANNALIKVPSEDAEASACVYSHPNRRCTQKVKGQVNVLRVSSDWIELSVSLLAEDLEHRIYWDVDRGYAFPR
jgi:hypothetical protein